MRGWETAEGILVRWQALMHKTDSHDSERFFKLELDSLERTYVAGTATLSTEY